MKRVELEQKIRQYLEVVRERIIGAPLPAFLVGILVGVVIALYTRFVLALVLLAVVVLVVLWLVSEDDLRSETSSRAGGESDPKDDQ